MITSNSRGYRGERVLIGVDDVAEPEARENKNDDHDACNQTANAGRCICGLARWTIVAPVGVVVLCVGSVVARRGVTTLTNDWFGRSLCDWCYRNWNGWCRRALGSNPNCTHIL